MGKVEKKQLVTFILTAYGVTFVLGFLMWFFYGRGADLSVFPNAQMFYPAAGVMLAYLVTKKVYICINVAVDYVDELLKIMNINEYKVECYITLYFRD